ncbi:hypothetical protein DdX_18055 [Ditylenchus destructor]|uniref:F-box domain-containing protein n=1 Tax=Ditylenchus destructor TaxID=166010 RepID=A0AAD4MMB0_9BILA|nr:hypothetical protein DdX_18055 [Ditylenchus destructor]
MRLLFHQIYSFHSNSLASNDAIFVSDLPQNFENGAQMISKVKKCRSENRTSIIDTIDNGTLVETFKYLNYMQLAKSSLISKKFSNLIRAQNSLALFYIDYIVMSEHSCPPADIKIFNKVLSLEEYNQWVIHNNYSKQIHHEGQVAEKQSKQCERNGYALWAVYKDLSLDENDRTVLDVRPELNDDNWPLFQHFVHLLTDPFIYIRHLKLTPRIDVAFLNLLAGTIHSDFSRLRCNDMVLFSNRESNIVNNVQKFIGWVKNNVLCNIFQISLVTGSNYDDELLDFLVTGAPCTYSITINLLHQPFSDVIVAFLQKFMDLRDIDENQMVRSIRGYRAKLTVEMLKLNYAKFIVKEEKSIARTVLLFELINNYIGKKLQITTRTIHTMYDESDFLLEIKIL